MTNSMDMYWENKTEMKRESNVYIETGYIWQLQKYIKNK